MKKHFPFLQTSILVLGIVLLFSSCKERVDECNANCQEIKQGPPDAFHYFLFPKDSWWEYELLDSNIVDTLKVDHIYTFYREDQCTDANVCTYYYTLYLSHSNLDYFPSSHPTDHSTEVFQIAPYGSVWPVTHGGGSLGIAGFGHFLTLPLHIGNQSNSIEVADTVHPLSTLAGNFKSLWLHRVGDTPRPSPKRIINFHMVKGVGIVQYELERGHIWQLKSYKINKK